MTGLVVFCYFATIGRASFYGAAIRYLVPRESCQWLQEDPLYTADFSGYTQATFPQWIDEAYGERAENVSRHFFNDDVTYGHVFYWSVEGSYYRAAFDADGTSHLRLIGEQEVLGITIEECLGQPDYAQAYENQGAETLFTVTEIVYSERGLVFQYTDTLGWFRFPSAANEGSQFSRVTRFVPTTDRNEVAHYLDREWHTQDYILGQRSPQVWANVTLQEWQGWGHIRVIKRDDFLKAAVMPTPLP